MGGLGSQNQSSWFARRRLDRILAILGVILALCILPLRFLVSHIYATALPIVLGSASIIYLIATRGDSALDYPLGIWGRTGARLMEGITLCGIALLFVYGGIAGQRTIIFYDLAGLVGTLVLGQILFVRRSELRPAIILFEIIAFGFVIRFIGLYSVAGYIGIDVWSHIAFVKGIRTQNSLRAMNSKYIASPFYHLLVAVTADLADLPNRSALYLSIGTIVTLANAMVYYGTRQLTEHRWALFATGLYTMSAQVIRWGLHLIPTSLGVAFFLVFMTALVRVMQEYRSRDLIVLVGAIIAVTLTHQVSAFITLVTLGIAFLAQLLVASDRFAPEGSPVNVTGLFAFGVGFVTLDWSVTPYSGQSFTGAMMLRLRNTLFQQIGLLQVSSSSNVSSRAGEAGTSLFTKVIAYINVFGFLALLFIAGLGSYYLFQRGNRTHVSIFAVSTIAVMSFFVLALPILGVGLFLPGRWYAFLYVAMAMVGVLGLRYLTYNLNPRVVAVGLVVFIMVVPGLMFISGAATLDNPVFDSKQLRYAFTEQEIDTVQTLDQITNQATPPIYTDAPYTAVFRRTDTAVSAPMMIPKGGGSAVNELVVYRPYQTHGAPVIANLNRSGRIAQVAKPRVCPATRTRLYTNGAVSMCRDPDAE